MRDVDLLSHYFFFSSRRRHTRFDCDWSSDVCSSDLVADMIGDRDLGIRREALSTDWLTDLLWTAAARRGFGAHFLPDTLAVEDDHAPFLRAGVPAALLIDFEYPPWHTAADTLDKVSARSLEVVGSVLLETLPAIEQRLLRK